MKKISTILLFLILAVFLMAGNAFALSLGANITIWDKMGVTNEDGEVEPNCVWDQAWDLEGFFLKGTILTMVGGYDFKDGYGNYAPGDIFIDTNGDAQYGTDNTGSGGGYAELNDTFGYEYALRLNFITNSGEYTYNLYGLTDDSTVAVYYGQNDESNPLRLVLDKYSVIAATGTFMYYAGLTDAEVGGLEGDDHYAVRVVLPTTDIPLDNFIAHYTYACGNDNLMGKVPEPSTMLLLGFGLIGLAAVGRKRFH